MAKLAPLYIPCHRVLSLLSEPLLNILVALLYRLEINISLTLCVIAEN